MYGYGHTIEMHVTNKLVITVNYIVVQFEFHISEPFHLSEQGLIPKVLDMS